MLTPHWRVNISICKRAPAFKIGRRHGNSSIPGDDVVSPAAARVQRWQVKAARVISADGTVSTALAVMPTVINCRCVIRARDSQRVGQLSARS